MSFACFEADAIAAPIVPLDRADTPRPTLPAASAPADGSPGFVDPFHFDWPHW
jgi:hypothetical protein